MIMLVQIDLDLLLMTMAKQKLNCSSLSKVSGVSRETISKIKKSAFCRPDIVGKIADALGLPVEELIVIKKE